MTEHDQIKALAKLDGFENLDRYFKQPASIYGKMQDMGTQDCKGESSDLLGRELEPVPNYCTSYDAIIPLIQKQPPEIRAEMFEQTSGRVIIMSTPAQLCEALLRATGKWKE